MPPGRIGPGRRGGWGAEQRTAKNLVGTVVDTEKCVYTHGEVFECKGNESGMEM